MLSVKSCWATSFLSSIDFRSKIRELTQLPSEGIHPSDLKIPGKLIVAEDKMPVIFVTSRERR